MGDVVNGKKLFMKLCVSCHTPEKSRKHKIGPNLHNIMGKTCGSRCLLNISISYNIFLNRENNLLKKLQGKCFNNCLIIFEYVNI